MTTNAPVAATPVRLPAQACWRRAARPKTLPLSQTPVLAGCWLAAQSGNLRPDIMAAAMFSAGAIQIGTNLWNDAADAARGLDTAERLGPPRMVAEGLLGAAEVRRAALASFALAALAGLYLAGLGGWPIVTIGLMSLALGYLYSMGPVPLSGLPVGEGLVILFFGIVAVSGTACLQGIDPFARRTLVVGAMVGLPAAAVLLLNNHRDRVQDARAGRHTLAILIGPAASRAAYALALAGALALATVAAPSPWLLPAAGLGLWLAVEIFRTPVSPALNRLIGLTALFPLLLLAGVALG